MKQLFVTFAFLLGTFFSLYAQKENPTTQSGSVIVSNMNAETAYEAQTDSIIQARVDKQVKKEIKKLKQHYQSEKKKFPLQALKETNIASIVALILVFAFPLLILGIVLYYRYKNKKARYEVMKQALAHGKNIPQEFGDTVPMTSCSNDLLWRKGIKTFFLGLGLALFLGILTNSSKLSSIGILIMCIGVGEIILGWFPSASLIRNKYQKHNLKDHVQNEQPDLVYSQEDASPANTETWEKTTPDAVEENTNADQSQPSSSSEDSAQSLNTQEEIKE